MKLNIKRPKGMKDIFEDADFYLKIKDLITKFSIENGFKYIETPVLENEKLYISSLGAASDVVMKEMFYIKGKEKKESFVLRPEGTASIVRAYFENNMINLPQPVKLFYIMKMYRKERPQLGRLREHTQWGLEILNTEDPFSDFFIIYLFDQIFKDFKIDVVFKLNSIGCEKCRPKYKKKLVSYYNKYKNKICDDCKRRLKENPLRLLDCKNQKDQEYKLNAPNILDSLCKFCTIHFQKVVDSLDYFKINYELDKTLVRGFDYYNRTVFEIFVSNYNFAIGGGGRYDLGKIVSDVELPSVGGAVGLERIKIIFDEKKITFKTYKPEIFVAFAGEEVRNKALEIYEELKNNGYKVSSNFFKTSLSSQLDYANKIGVKYSLILGFQELGKDSIILKDMMTGIQETLKIKNLIKDLKQIIKEK